MSVLDVLNHLQPFRGGGHRPLFWHFQPFYCGSYQRFSNTKRFWIYNNKKSELDTHNPSNAYGTNIVSKKKSRLGDHWTNLIHEGGRVEKAHKEPASSHNSAAEASLQGATLSLEGRGVVTQLFDHTMDPPISERGRVREEMSNVVKRKRHLPQFLCFFFRQQRPKGGLRFLGCQEKILWWFQKNTAMVIFKLRFYYFCALQAGYTFCKQWQFW